MTEPWQHYYQSQRLKLSYWTWGDAANPPLVLVHGGRDHARSWDEIAEAFCDEYHVVACDLRGHGDSDRALGTTYPLIEHIADLVALIDLVGGRARVIAHSFGGGISLLTAGAFPERFERLVAIEGAGARAVAPEREPLTAERLRDWTMRQRALEQQSPRVYPSPEAAAERMREANPQLSDEKALHLARWGVNGIDGGYTWKFDPWARVWTPFEVRADDMMAIWGKIECPVLHLVGSKSDRYRASFRGHTYEELFRDARTEVIEDAGHWLHHDQPTATIEAIRRFLGPPPSVPPSLD
jgi:pimeloyl-ACP methyl ester carboxylesterase